MDQNRKGFLFHKKKGKKEIILAVILRRLGRDTFGVILCNLTKDTEQTGSNVIIELPTLTLIVAIL